MSHETYTGICHMRRKKSQNIRDKQNSSEAATKNGGLVSTKMQLTLDHWPASLKVIVLKSLEEGDRRGIGRGLFQMKGWWEDKEVACKLVAEGKETRGN